MFLLDVIGGANVSTLHPNKPIVAYTCGCMIIVHDLLSDAKFQLVNHQNDVLALAFTPAGAGNSPNGGDYLISIDYNGNAGADADSAATMCMWNWSRGICMQEIHIPQS